MASSASTDEGAKLTLLSLPDEILAKIFSQLCTTTKYTLQTVTHALNLARTNTRLTRIFSGQLTSITPSTEIHAETLLPKHYHTLIRMAGDNLRELHIPYCAYEFVHQLPEMCPNLDLFSFVCFAHEYATDYESGDSVAEDQLLFDGELDILEDDGNDSEDLDDENDYEAGMDEEDDYDSVNNDSMNSDSSDNDTIDAEGDDNQAGDIEADDEASSVNEASDCDCSIYDSSDSDSMGSESTNSDASYIDESRYHDNAGSHDGREAVEVSFSSDEDDNRCPALSVLTRLKLREISVTKLPYKFVEVIQSVAANNILQQLQFHEIRRHELAYLIPLFVQPLKSLTVTTSHIEPSSERLSKFIDALMERVPYIPSITVQSPAPSRLDAIMEKSVNLDTLDFPAEAASMIRSVRENNFESKCKSINLAGEITFGLLVAVDRNASITLSSERITVCDHGDGTHITSLPLYDEFLDEDVSHLEKAYILERPELEGGAIVEYKWSDEWARRLAGRRLRVIRSFDANVLNRLELSTESLELFCTAIPNVTNWSFLNGVRELYLLGPTSNYTDREETKIDPLIKLLPQLIDAFQGELICTGLYSLRERVNCDSPEVVIQFVNKTKDAINRFVRRGGDAATLSFCLKAVLRNLSVRMKREETTRGGVP